MNMDLSGNGRHHGYESHQSMIQTPNGNSKRTHSGNGNHNKVRETKNRFEINDSNRTRHLTDEEIDSLLADVPRPINGVFDSLSHLRNAKDTALKCDKNPDLFAVSLNEMSDRGLVSYQLQWLTHNHFIVRCLNLPSGVETVFESNGAIRSEDAYVLTQNGDRLLDKLQLKLLQERRSHLNHKTTIVGKPIYNSEKHLLIFDEKVVKRFRWAASNQERVLMAFEEENWPRRIDDPLLPDPNICPKRRLHDTIKCLNRRQENKLVRFRGDGTGTGVLWELWDLDDTSSTQDQSK